MTTSADRVHVTFALGRYDRTVALADGRVQVEGVALNPLFLAPEECFFRMVRHGEFDASEMSLASYAILCARGDDRFVGLPAFLSRSFRHSSMYVRADSAVRTPADLAGCRFGVPEYQMTASVWTRGLLQHDYDVDIRGIAWRTGGLEEPGREERQRLALPDWLDVEPIPTTTSLSEALLDGSIDALMAPRMPQVFQQPDPPIRRVIPDYAEQELAYYRRTGLFPIMHMVVVRRALVDAHPWLPASLYKALRQARALALDGARELPALPVTMPFLLHALEQQLEVFGDDPWPYGLPANREALRTFLGYMVEQGLLEENLEPESLFAASALGESRI